MKKSRYSDSQILVPIKNRGNTRRYENNASDDETRIRALKIYRKHTQKNAISFIDNITGAFH